MNTTKIEFRLNYSMLLALLKI